MEDMDMFRRATVVVGPHGGAFGNIAFLPSGSHVVEFLPIRTLANRNPRGARPCFLGLAFACRHKYWSVGATNFGFYRSGMIVNVSEVLSALRHIGVLKSGGVGGGDPVGRASESAPPADQDWGRSAPSGDATTGVTSVVRKNRRASRGSRPGRLRRAPAVAVEGVGRESADETTQFGRASAQPRRRKTRAERSNPSKDPGY